MCRYTVRVLVTLIVVSLLIQCATATTEANGIENKKFIRVLIGFKDIDEMKRHKNEFLTFIKTHNCSVKRFFKLYPIVAAKVPRDMLDAIKRLPFVKYVEKDVKVHLIGVSSSSTQTVPWGVARIHADYVHSYTKGKGVKIAILDTGIDYNHPDLKDNYKGGYDFVNNDPDPMDDNGHGTHVAGIIAAEDNDFGVVGVAPEASIYAVKVLDSTGSGYVSDVIAGIEWAIEHKVQIISMSLGSDQYSQALEDACNKAYEAGILLVAAAGNSGNEWGIGDTVEYPARFSSVIAVAAIDENDNRASFSSTGPEVELAAPGVNINSTWIGGGYKILSGTSMACPHVTGVAALVWSLHPDYNNTQIREILDKTAEDLGDPGRDTWYGYGLVDAKVAAYLDTTPPKIYNVSVINVTSTTATIFWQTDELSNSTVRYGTSIPPNITVTNSTLTTTHIVKLKNLNKNTTYYFEVVSVDSSGNIAVDNNNGSYYVFKTLPNMPPVANAGNDIIVYDSDNNSIEVVTLNASKSYDPDGYITEYEWFENNTLIGIGKIIEYNFSVGTHKITLIVKDNDEATAEDKINVTVKPNQRPIPIIEVNKTKIYVNETILFNASKSYDPDGRITRYEWYFGDGTSDTGIIVSHKYSRVGKYTVKLKVIDNGGAVNSTTINVTVLERPLKPLYVNKIMLLIELREPFMRALAIVSVNSDSGPVDKAKVMGHWSGLFQGLSASVTNKDGLVLMMTPWIHRTAGKFTFTVDNVVKQNYIYSPEHNKETSKTIIYK